MSSIGISLTGGGARGSYQAGVLKGLTDILKEENLLGQKNPFHYWSGVSAGSINATYCASELENLDSKIFGLLKLWSDIQPEKVYLTDFKSLSSNSFKWIHDLTLGNLAKKKWARSLLNTAPLWNLIGDNIVFKNIETGLASGLLKGLACSAYSYRDNQTVTFLQTHRDTEWHKTRRYSRKTKIQAEHVVASCSIPILFPAVNVSNEFFADGGFRNTSPISPLIHMGAKKILMIGVRGPDEFSDKTYIQEPGVAKIAGVILNALFFDTIEIDLERVNHLNEIIEAVQKEDIETSRSEYTKIDYKVITPSRDISRLASTKTKSIPKMIEFLVGGLGSMTESAELASYLLFSPEFTRELIDLGHKDTMVRKDELIDWIRS